MASSTASSGNTDTVDGGGGGSSDQPAVLQKKLFKIEKCILQEEALLASIQDKFIQLGMQRGVDDPAKHSTKVRELEQANDKASRHIEEFKRKKRKYEAALRAHEEQQRQDVLLRSAEKGKKDMKDVKSGFSLDRKEAGKMLSLISRAKNGETGSARWVTFFVVEFILDFF